MNMGRPEIVAAAFRAAACRRPARRHAAVDVGNPQCAVPVDDFDFDWRAMGAEIERHPHFPNRTNVSFVKPVDAHTIDVRFCERGAGETMSSGTGSHGRGGHGRGARARRNRPVRVRTPAGPLDVRIEGNAFPDRPRRDLSRKVEFFL